MSRDKTDYWVGIFVLLGGLALSFLVLRAGNLSSFLSGNTYPLLANFDNIGGLKLRAPVKSSGVVVGRVSSISLDNKLFQAQVTLEMKDKYKFPKDSSASILTSGLLGEQYIGISPGSSEKNFTEKSKILYTQSAVVLENLISQFLYSSAEKKGSLELSSPVESNSKTPAVAP